MSRAVRPEHVVGWWMRRASPLASLVGILALGLLFGRSSSVGSGEVIGVVAVGVGVAAVALVILGLVEWWALGRWPADPLAVGAICGGVVALALVAASGLVVRTAQGLLWAVAVTVVVALAVGVFAAGDARRLAPDLAREEPPDGR